MNRARIHSGAVVLFVLLQACASAQNHLEPAAAASQPVAAGETPGSAGDTRRATGNQRGEVCSEESALPASLVETGGVVLFGEGVHGTQELPQAFGEAVCSVADSRKPVRVGLEIESGNQAIFDTFLASPG